MSQRSGNYFKKPQSQQKWGQQIPVEDQIVFRGVVSKITYHNEENGYSIVRAEPDPSSQHLTNSSGYNEPVTIVGVFPVKVSSGINIVAKGTWQNHPKFGKQFKAISISETVPTSNEAIIRYLGSGLIKGFGPSLAEKIVEKFGERTIEILNSKPSRLKEIPGIGEKKYEELVSSWGEKQFQREVVLFFQNYEIPMGLSKKIHNHYGDHAIDVVKKNPFALAKDIHGIGFHTADRIAMALGTDPLSRERLSAGLVHIVKEASSDGHLYVPKEVLIPKTASLLNLDDTTLLKEGLKLCALEGQVVIEEENVYLTLLNKAERVLAKSVADLLSETPKLRIPDYMLESALAKKITTPDGQQGVKIIELSKQQKEAITLSANNSLIVITGGPGCGKTTLVKTLAGLFRQAGLNIKLVAPTGRAAQRLAEVCEVEASTIHRLLKYDPSTNSFSHNRDSLLTADAIIVDESSMIDVPLAGNLFEAIAPGARVILVGDADQLPSVGPGLFLGDMLGVEEVPRVNLTTLFRRDIESSINHVAYQINHAEVPDIPEPDGLTKSDCYFVKAKDIEESAVLLERLVTDQIPKKFGFDPSQITVLSPMNQGELGVIALNRRLQDKLITNKESRASVEIGNLKFYLGDRVCQRVNNYNIVAGGVFNGDQGEVIGIDSASKSLVVRFWDGREITYPADAITQLDLAYALTIHRAQGSEVPVIVMALHESHHILLERQLLYTGITRAKKLLIIVGSKKAFSIAVKRNRSKKRFTSLQERIHSNLK